MKIEGAEEEEPAVIEAENAPEQVLNEDQGEDMEFVISATPGGGKQEMAVQGGN